MLTAEYLPPYSLLVGQFLGAIRIFTAKESAQDDIFSMLGVENENASIPVVINSVKVGVSDIPVSEINVKVNVSEPMFPVINNTKAYKVAVEKIVDAIARNPNNKLDIIVTDSKFNAEYDNIQTFFPIESVPIGGTDQVQKEFENSAYAYLKKVYGIKMENKATLFVSPSEKLPSVLVAAGDPRELYMAKTYLTELPEWMRTIVSYVIYIMDKIHDLAVSIKNKIVGAAHDVKEKISDSDKASDVITAGKQKTSDLKQAIVTFIDNHPLIATAVVVGAVAGALALYFKRKAITRFLRRESINTNVYAALLDIADVLTIVNPSLSAEEVYKQSKQILKQSGKRGIQNFSRLTVAKENQQSGGGVTGLAIIAVLLKIGAFIFGTGFVLSLLGTIFLVIKAAIGLGLNTDHVMFAAASTIQFGFLLGVTSIGYLIVKKYLDGKINRQINSESQVKQQLVKANSKMFDLGYNMK